MKHTHDQNIKHYILQYLNYSSVLVGGRYPESGTWLNLTKWLYIRDIYSFNVSRKAKCKEIVIFEESLN